MVHKAKSSQRNAFTLIELLVVISVIALLMAIAIPVFGKVRSQARGLVCRTNLRQWGMTLNVYAMESNGRLPTAGTRTGYRLLLRGRMQDPDDPNQEGRQVHHFDTQGVTLCPSAKKPGERGTFTTSVRSDDGSWSVRITGIPGATNNAWTITKPTPASYGSYGYNGWLSQGFSRDPRINKDLRALGQRHKIPVLLDSLMPWGRASDAIPPPSREGRGGPIGNHCINRHNGHVNGLFLDWSVRRVGLKELWSLKWYIDFDAANPWTQAGGVRPEDWPEWMRRFKDY